MALNEFLHDRMWGARAGGMGVALLAAVLISAAPALAGPQLSIAGPGLTALSVLREHHSIGGAREMLRAEGQEPGSSTPHASQGKQEPQAQSDRADTLRARQALMQLMTEGNLPRLGPPDAPVTILIFSDFECPYCRKLMDILEQKVLPGEGKRVQVVYRNFPLTNHPWAFTAAEEAGCAATQSNDDFWALHNKIFENQKTINKENAKSRIMEIAKSVPGLNFAAFQSCVEKQGAMKEVLKDVSLGDMASIYATPTLFVNGWRLDGVADAEELKKVIGYALRDSQPGADSDQSGAKGGAAPK
jgi:protein-disulfide isomerase